MKIHDYSQFPEGYDYAYGEIEPLSKYDLEDLKSLNVDEVWYWYAAGDYEGSGKMLMRRGNKYDIHSLSHCSCYGPLEDAVFAPKYSSLDEIRAKCSEEAYKEIAPLVDMAKEGK
jgi:hypothetical protein